MAGISTDVAVVACASWPASLVSVVLSSLLLHATNVAVAIPIIKKDLIKKNLTSKIKVAKVTSLKLQELPFLIYFAFVTLVPLI